MLESQLIEYNRLGFVPGPQETEADYLARVEYNLNRDSVMLAMAEGVSEKITDVSPAGLQKTLRLYDIQPNWIPVLFSNFKLAPWHGGCAWIFQMAEESPTASFFQLRSLFKSQNHLFGLYQKDELVAHELAHVGRMMFQEPKFEEIHAYRSSDSVWRRWLGPIVQSSFESMLFVLVLFLILMVDAFFIFSDQPEAFHISMWGKLVPLGLIFFALARLWWRQRMYDACLKHLEEIVDADKARAIIYRLTDAEIKTFAGMSGEAILGYAKEQEELRWEVIRIYFSSV